MFRPNLKKHVKIEGIWLAISVVMLILFILYNRCNTVLFQQDMIMPRIQLVSNTTPDHSQEYEEQVEKLSRLSSILVYVSSAAGYLVTLMTASFISKVLKLSLVHFCRSHIIVVIVVSCSF